MESYNYVGFLGFLGFLGLNNPIYYMFFAFFLFFLKSNPKNKTDRNIIQFYAGLLMCLGSAAWTFFGNFHPSHTVVLIIGLALIATSNYRLLK